jgi:N6-L-threonylcarbamoyladenine synthase
VRLGSTLDDAVGEAFDKVARDLELPWMVNGVSASPGAALEALAATGDASTVQPPLPVPMRAKPSQRGHCDFSFAGLKAAVKRKVETGAPLSDAARADMAAAFQEAAIQHIVDRMETGLEWCQPGNGAAWAAAEAPRCLVVSGGVGSNMALRIACVAQRHALCFCFSHNLGN